MTRPPHAMDNGVAIYVPLAPVIQAERILRIQGYPDLDRVRPAIRNSAQSMAALAPQLSSARVGYGRIPIRSIRNDVLEVEGGQFHCAAFARILFGCTEVAAFVLTVGPRLDARVVELTEAGELLDALLLETAGWLCIEDATRQFKVHLREEANARGCRITSRMGPGYSYKLAARVCIWPLEEQIELFGLFQGADLPVAVMESCAMQPKMSRSGLFGVAPLPAPAPTRAGKDESLCAMPGL
ncbi:MAG: hypothetical protein ABJC33_00445 [Betaproteobacteria bacterium]